MNTHLPTHCPACKAPVPRAAANRCPSCRHVFRGTDTGAGISADTTAPVRPARSSGDA